MAKVGWIDTHTHLAYHEKDKLSENLKYARDHHVSDVVAIALDWDEYTFHQSLRSSNQDITIHLTLGAHPAEVYKWNHERFNACLAQIKKADIIALGEIGLDYYWDKQHHDLQKERFIAQINLANELELPILVHCRDAFADCLAILQAHPPQYHGIMHCFSGSEEMAKEFLKVGMDISFAGPLTFKNASELKIIAQSVPLDRLHIETDAPYLTPHPYRGKRNQTGYVHYVGAELSKIKNIAESDVKNQLALNFERLFSKKLTKF